MRKRIALCDEDTEYAVRVAEYVKESDYRREAEIAVCSRPELLLEWWRSGSCDLYVASVEFEERLKEAAGSDGFVWIGEGRREALDGSAVVSKYEAVPKLLSMWLSRCGGGRASKARRAPIVGIWSVAGGAGRTRIAAHAAIALAAKGRKPFLLAVDPVPDGGRRRCSSAEHDIGEWLYAIKAGRPIPGPEESLPLDADMHRLSPESSFREWQSIRSSEGERLLEAAAGSFGCGIVLADAGAGWSPWGEQVWRHSEAVVCIVPEEEISVRKTDKWLQEWPEWGDGGTYRMKCRFVVNKCVRPEPRFVFSWCAEAFRLPYVPEWKQDAGRGDPLFSEAADRLAEELWSRCARSGA
ncbi:hypothetical protein [Paenibacillus sp.]|uniref:hypothetical protein n=1 Tax=Paenibacillus sp. TaxID=58172 RepID=UPI002D4A6B32|nr:hypothetical protein [Paenibacillus sp.]HZG88510.1 hypothetical protein [Paenibacillus sp.]